MPTTIDAWAQIPTPRMTASPWLEPLMRWTGQNAADLTPSTADTLAEMDRGGVDVAILSAWHGPEGDLISNEEVAAQIEAAPDRFRGLAAVDIRRPVQAVREVRRWVEEVGFVGVRIVPWLWDLPPNDRRFYPIYAACAEAGVPVCTQIGHTGPLRRSETGRPIPYLEDVLLDFPELKVVGGHVGYPWVAEVGSLTIKFENLFVDTSAYVIDRLPTEFRDFMRGVGRRRVMFGTNWPMLAPSACLKGLDDLDLPQATREAFLGATAAAVFGIANKAPREAEGLEAAGGERRMRGVQS
jgi:uncharacterized protein